MENSLAIALILSVAINICYLMYYITNMLNNYGDNQNYVIDKIISDMDKKDDYYDLKQSIKENHIAITNLTTEVKRTKDSVCNHTTTPTTDMNVTCCSDDGTYTHRANCC